MITYCDTQNISKTRDERFDHVHFDASPSGVSLIDDDDGTIYITSDAPTMDEAEAEIVKYITENY